MWRKRSSRDSTSKAQGSRAMHDAERTAQLFCAVLNRWRQFSENDLAATQQD